MPTQTINQRLGAAAKEIREAANKTTEEIARWLAWAHRRLLDLEGGHVTWSAWEVHQWSEYFERSLWGLAFPDPKSAERELLAGLEWAATAQAIRTSVPFSVCPCCWGLRPIEGAVPEELPMDGYFGHKPDCKWKALFPEVAS